MAVPHVVYGVDEDASLLALLEDLDVDGGVVGGGNGEEGSVQVAVGIGPPHQLDDAVTGELVEALGGALGDHHHRPSGVEQSPALVLGHRTAPDHHAPATLDVESQPVAEGHVRRPAMSVVQTCSPHSVLAEPAQRPSRACSPASTGRVHGQQPMER